MFQDFSLKNLVRVLMFLCSSEMYCYLMEEQKVPVQRFTKLVYHCYVLPHCMNLWCTTAKFHLGFKCMLLAGSALDSYMYPKIDFTVASEMTVVLLCKPPNLSCGYSNWMATDSSNWLQLNIHTQAVYYNTTRQRIVLRSTKAKRESTQVGISTISNRKQPSTLQIFTLTPVVKLIKNVRSLQWPKYSPWNTFKLWSLHYIIFFWVTLFAGCTYVTHYEDQLTFSTKQ